MPAPLALIEDAPHGDVRVVSVRGEIDVGTSAALREWVERASERGRRSVAVDLGHVDFMAVSGVYVLCDEAARLARNEAQLTVVCTNPRTLRLFEICRVGDALPVVADVGALGRGPAWGRDDDRRAAKLDAWLERYSAGATAPA